ncbi:hypothetical protein Vafri_179 [Volvox africanus]|nr:hypothetical protein Vafri_179 [Volvox africanus]
MGDFITRLRTGLNPQYTARVSATSLTGPGTAKNVRDRPLLAAREPSVGILPGRGRRLRSQLYGAAILLVTTVLWASGGPTTKYLFLLPAPPSAALLTACISVITALFLGVGLIGTYMEPGSGGRYNRAAVSDPAAAAAATAPERNPSGADTDADEAEAEALLHSGMHTTGAAGGALVAACAAAREAAQEQERERALWARAQECALPLLPSHGSYFYSSLASHSRGDPPDTELGKSSATLANEAALISGDRGSGMGEGAGAYPRRGPSLDGTVAGPSAPSSPSPQLPRNHDRMPRATGHDVNVGPRRRSTEGGAAGPVPGRWRLRLLTAPARSLPAAGLELGIYNVTAAALGAWGMQRISATRSAFLAQATSLLTPLLVWLSGGRVGVMVWLACFCGALGGAMVALDNVYGAAAAAAAGSAASTGGHGRRIHELLTLLDDAPGLMTASSDGSTAGCVTSSAAAANAAGLVNDRTLLSAGAAVAAAASPAAMTGGRLQVEGVLLSRQAMGAAYVLMSCVFWGLGTVRLGVHSARFRPLQLAAAAAVCYAGLSLLWLFTEILGSPSAGLSDFLELGLLFRNHVTAALLLWAGLGPGALSSYLQVLGQQTVPPAQAQVLFSSTPLWSALIAQLLLPGEAMGPLAWFGGAIMLGASLLASIWQ